MLYPTRRVHPIACTGCRDRLSTKTNGSGFGFFGESLDRQTGKFTINRVGPATTDEDGHWKQSIVMWRGDFHIYAVVMTEEGERLHRWAISARDAALKIAQQQPQNPAKYDIPGWPLFDSLPDPCRSDKYHINVV